MTPHKTEEIPEICGKTFLSIEEYSKNFIGIARWVIGIAFVILSTSVGWAITQSVKVSALEVKMTNQNEAISKVSSQNEIVLKKLDGLSVLLSNLK